MAELNAVWKSGESDKSTWRTARAMALAAGWLKTDFIFLAFHNQIGMVQRFTVGRFTVEIFAIKIGNR